MPTPIKPTPLQGCFSVTSVLLCALTVIPLAHAEQPLKIAVDWSKTVSVSKSTPSVQVIPNARTRRGGPLHEVTFSALKKLDAKYVRYLAWGPYPRLQIAALEPPTPEKTSWNFSHIDPEMIDFLNATKGREPVINFSSIPPWMFKRSTPVSYPEDVDEMDWGCADSGRSRELVDPTGQQLAAYYARIVSWYTQGGFTDEIGKYHHSGHHYELPWWGVLNEPDPFGPQQYTVVYDAIVSSIRKVSPKTRFVALELAGTSMPGMPFVSPTEFVEYFLDPKNHRPGIPLDMIAYHFYAIPGKSQTVENWQYTFFDQADTFLTQVNHIEAIRKRFSPATLTYTDELGSHLPEDMDASRCLSDETNPAAIPPDYWNLSAALYAYLYMELAKQGIDVVGQAGFNFYPGNFPSVSVVNWTTRKLNAKFHVLQLIKDNFGPGDKLVATKLGFFPRLEDMAAQAFETSSGKKLLVINKRSRPIEFDLDTVGQVVRMNVVDQKSGENPARGETLRDKRVHLEPFAVAVLTISLTDLKPQLSTKRE